MQSSIWTVCARSPGADFKRGIQNQCIKEAAGQACRLFYLLAIFLLVALILAALVILLILIALVVLFVLAALIVLTVVLHEDTSFRDH